jgi:hypothetical protein
MVTPRAKWDRATSSLALVAERMARPALDPFSLQHESGSLDEDWEDFHFSPKRKTQTPISFSFCFAGRGFQWAAALMARFPAAAPAPPVPRRPKFFEAMRWKNLAVESSDYQICQAGTKSSSNRC